MTKRDAHQNGTDTSSLCFSYDNRLLVSRGGKFFNNIYSTYINTYNGGGRGIAQFISRPPLMLWSLV